MSVASFTAPSGQVFKLGRISPTLAFDYGNFRVREYADGHRSVTLRLGAYHDSALSTAALPEATNYRSKATESLRRVYLNDQYGDCHPPGTLISMADGTTKRIEEVNVLDQVVTAEGNTGPVSAVMSRYENSVLVRIVAWGHSHLRMTANHPLLTKRGYVPAGEIVPGDWIVMPVRKTGKKESVRCAEHFTEEGLYHVNKTSKRGYAASVASQKKTIGAALAVFPDKVTLTPGFGRIIGLFLSEGSTNQNLVCWTFGPDERDTLVAELIRLLRDELGVEGVVSERRSAIEIRVCGKLWRILFRSLCGEGAKGKRLHRDLAGGPKEFLHAVLEAWLDGDGCKIAGGRTGTTVSHSLAVEMMGIAQMLGMNASIRGRQPNSSRAPNGPNGKLVSVNASFRWDVAILNNPTKPRIEVSPEVVWRPVRRIEREPYSGQVFNLEVAGDNSYVAEGVGVHNCVIASKYHSVGVWTGNDAGDAVQGTDREVLDAYHRICGPGDNGCIITDVMDSFKSRGLLFNGVTHKIDDYVSIDWTNKALVKVAIFLFASGPLGINLPSAWANSEDGGRWDVTNTRSVGGHDVPVIDYDQDGVWISTWGGTRLITWPAFTSRRWIEEFDVPLSPDWYGSDNLAPNGISAERLKNDLRMLRDGEIPPIDVPPPPLVDYFV